MIQEEKVVNEYFLCVRTCVCMYLCMHKYLSFDDTANLFFSDAERVFESKKRKTTD